MKSSLITGALLISMLTACGGGGGGSDGATVVTPPVSGGSESTGDNTGGSTSDNASVVDAASALAFTNTGTASTPYVGVTRTTKTTATETAYADILDGTNTGRVFYKNENGGAISSLVGSAPTATPQSGVYTGKMDATWKSSQTGTVQTASNNVSVEVDLSSGEASISSYLVGQTENALIANGAQVTGSTIHSDNAFVGLLDSSGSSIGYAEGQIDGYINGGSTVLGTVNATNADSGAQFTGGFTAAK
ncbi:hypothetical protein [Paenirhodobacter populi]|uniref:hypothetical protein n=1 Tax=Paenirhodobacter populi TaxID=2306993 RepID=UPI000FE303D0|nr:hypothetical protein [Sinirhodobacter populi]RWR05091.1 hypothetical protein D2T32_17755 [Sinirhodobacter populi]